MGGIDVGASQDKRSLNREINMIPFIDFLLVMVAFLLITAVWVTFSRQNVNAELPGGEGPVTPRPVEKVLHVHAKPEEFALVWRHGATVISESRVRRDPDVRGEPRFDALATAVATEWQTHGEHRDPADSKPDLAVLHTDNRTPFREIVATIDAVHGTQRERLLASGERYRVPAFNVAFSAH